MNIYAKLQLARETLEQLEYVECNACVTGDCTHNSVHDCATALGEELAHVSALAKEVRGQIDGQGPGSVGPRDVSVGAIPRCQPGPSPTTERARILERLREGVMVELDIDDQLPQEDMVAATVEATVDAVIAIIRGMGDQAEKARST